MATPPGHTTTDPCACGVCGTDVPPLVGSTLAGTGLTLNAAADLLVDGKPLPPMTAVQLRLVDQHAETRATAGELAAGSPESDQSGSQFAGTGNSAASSRQAAATTGKPR